MSITGPARSVPKPRPARSPTRHDHGLGPALGQAVVVENEPGAAGGLGAGYAKSATRDGYTRLGGTISTRAINASLYKDLRYEPIKDFEPITLVGFIPNALYVNPALARGGPGSWRAGLV